MFPPGVLREAEKLADAVRREAQELILELRNSRRIRFYWGRHPKRGHHVAFYRLIYEVIDATRTIRILRIAYRDEVAYRVFDRW